MFRGILLASFLVFPIAFSGGTAFAGDHPPKVDTSQPTPVVYPKGSQANGEEGTVVLGVDVTKSGQPRDVRVMSSSGHPDLDTAATETAFNWHYLPAVRDGEAAEDWVTVQVKYALPENATAVSK
ncbi:MAG TPA: energy transducer TonB [Rhizomicrobium sp.]|jgi:protein TonB